MNCPRCAGQFWVNENSPEGQAEAAPPPSSTPSGGNGAPAPIAPGVVRAAASPAVQAVPVPPAARWSQPVGQASNLPAPVGQVANLPSPASIPSAHAPSTVPAAPVVAVAPGGPAPIPNPAAPVAAPPVMSPARKVARLVTSDAASSTLKLAADGQLPDLHLDQGESKKAEAKPRTVHPAVLFSILAVSVCVSIWLVLSDAGTPPPTGKAKADARRYIREHYFGSGTLDGGELAPYQIYLREAQQAHSRGDQKAERQSYRKVLGLLRADPAGRQRGLTGSRTRDNELETRVMLLLSEN